MSTADVDELPGRVRYLAVVLDNGEVMWSFDAAPEAIRELARLGRVVLGLDAREKNESGLVTEVPISAFEPYGRPEDVEQGRQQAIDALGQAQAIAGWPDPLILITWRPL